jgi:stress response protein YsnF
MDGHNVVAVFATRVEAERARDRLIEIGIPAADIRLGGSDLTDRTGVTEAETVTAPRHEGFWDWLFGRDVPDYDRTWYESSLREGHTVVSVLVHNTEERHRVADILEDFNPIDFDETESRYRGIESSTATVGTTTAAGGLSHPETTSSIAASGVAPRRDESLGSPQTWEHERDAAVRDAAIRSGDALGAGERRAELGAGEQVIPVVKEDIAVGKRAQERRYRIRTYTVETPVERDVTLRDERVVIERRPVVDQTEAARLAAERPQNREYEVIERHEEPVIEKRRDVEEVVVHKEATDRTERVHDTVRETRVDVEKDADVAANRLERPVREDRKP